MKCSGAFRIRRSYNHMKKNKNNWIRFALKTGIILAAAGLIYFAFVAMMPDLIPLLKSGNESQIEQYLRDSNKWLGLLFTALLQFVQVLSVILPGTPIQIAAGIVYGTWRAFFVCHLSSVATNLLVFNASRRLGNKMDVLIPVNSKSSKMDFIRKSENPAYMTVVACLVPILPNGFIPYAAAKTKITSLQFGLAMYFGSLMPVLVLCAAGSKIMQGGYIASALLLGILFLAVILLSRYKHEVLKIVTRISEREKQKLRGIRQHYKNNSDL